MNGDTWPSGPPKAPPPPLGSGTQGSDWDGPPHAPTRVTLTPAKPKQPPPRLNIGEGHSEGTIPGDQRHTTSGLRPKRCINLCGRNVFVYSIVDEAECDRCSKTGTQRNTAYGGIPVKASPRGPVPSRPKRPPPVLEGRMCSFCAPRMAFGRQLDICPSCESFTTVIEPAEQNGEVGTNGNGASSSGLNVITEPKREREGPDVGDAVEPGATGGKEDGTGHWTYPIGRTCGSCYQQDLGRNDWMCPENHAFCKECTQTMLVESGLVRCPECPYEFTEVDAARLDCPREVIDKLQDLALKNAIRRLNIEEGVKQVSCPRPNCGHIGFIDDNGHRVPVECPECKEVFFSHCNEVPYHYHGECANLNLKRKEWASFLEVNLASMSATETQEHGSSVQEKLDAVQKRSKDTKMRRWINHS